MSQPTTDNFQSPEHAFLTGSLLMALMMGKATLAPEIDDDGNYLPKLLVEFEVNHVAYEVSLDVPLPVIIDG